MCQDYFEEGKGSKLGDEESSVLPGPVAEELSESHVDFAKSSFEDCRDMLGWSLEREI